MLNLTAAQHRKASTKDRRLPRGYRILIPFFVAAFFLGGIVCGYLLYLTAREFVANVDLPALPVIRFPSLRLSPARASQDAEGQLPQLPGTTPGAEAGDLAYAPPAELRTGERINILLLGIDRRGKQGWDQRTDTIVIVTVDPANHTAGMLSIPRDLQLAIPGNGEDRINTANVWGESQGYPGGGPALLKRTIEANFGISINYYIMVDFKGFERIVDTLGGVDIDVPRALVDTKFPDPLPGDPYHYTTIRFDAGLQHMDGARALQYVRSRMSTSDFDRAKRQQQILVAIRDKALGLNLIPKLPALAATMMDSVKTDMALDEMLRLASLAPQVDMNNLKRVVLEKPLVYGYKRPSDGASVQLPKWELIRPIIDDLFYAPVVAVVPTATPAPPTPTPTLAPAQIEDLEELARDGARIAVQNGTSQSNFAARVAALLMEQGFQVVEFGDADRVDYANTVIVDYTGKTYTLERLADLFSVASQNLRRSPNLRSRVDIRVIVGQDFFLPSP